MDENVCYLIPHNAPTTNNQQIFRVSLHCLSFLIFHPSPETFPLFIPRLIDPCLFPPHLTTAEWNHSVNVYCFVFINKNATTESSTSFDKGWKIIMFNVHTIRSGNWHKSWSLRMQMSIGIVESGWPLNVEWRCRSSIWIRETENHHVFLV